MAKVSGISHARAPRIWAGMAVLALAVGVLAACSAPSIESVDPSEGAKGFPVGEWEACALPGQPDRRCGSVEVGAASGDDDTKVAIAVAVTPARKADGAPKGVLIVDPGGPLLSGVTSQAGFAATIDAEIRDSFDIVGYDRRGFGRSTPITCDIADPPVFTAADIDTEWSSFEKGARAELKKCDQETDGRVLEAGINAGVRDLEAVRTALKADRIDMLAISYGTLLGQAYLAEHPDRVRTMILDGTMDPESTGPQQTLDGMLESADAAASYGTDRDPELADGFVPAFQKMAEVYDSAAPYSQDLAYNCTDFPWPSTPEEEADGLTAEQQAEVLSTHANCYGWPGADPIGALDFPDDAPKPLLINGLDDRRTPIEDARTVAERTGGVLITMPGSFHGLVNNFTCPTDIAEAYLLTAQLPAASECPQPKPIGN
ncbi:alpha/beta fold hydrolase [Microbacterium sp. NPDC055665]